MRKIIATLGVATIVGLSTSACTDPFTGAAPTPASVSAELAILCAGANAISAIVLADGQIIGVSSSAQANIATGQQLITVNCQALQAAIPVVAGAGSATASPTALVSAEREWAPRIGIPQATLDRIVKHYAR